MAKRDENIKWLYNKLTEGGFDIGTQDEFTKSLDNEEDRQWYYNKGRSMGYNMGTYDQFVNAFRQEPILHDSSTEEMSPMQSVMNESIHNAESTMHNGSNPDLSGVDVTKAEAEGQPLEGAWTPTEQDKIASKAKLDAMLQEFQDNSQPGMNKTQRAMERLTPEGREKLKAGEMQARMAGVPTQLLGATPNQTGSAVEGETDVEGNGQQKVRNNGQSPVPYGVKYVDGKPVTEWLLPDGTLTTDILEADKAEGEARTERLRQQFEGRMKQNGLDPTKDEDVMRQSIFDKIERNNERIGVKNAGYADDMRKQFEWREDEGFFENLGRLAQNSIMSAEGVKYGTTLKEEADTDLQNMRVENYVLCQALKRLDANGLKKSEGILGGMFNIGNNLKNLGAGLKDVATDPSTYLFGQVEMNMAQRLLDIDSKVRNAQSSPRLIKTLCTRCCSILMQSKEVAHLTCIQQV